VINQHDQGRRDGQFVLSTPTEVENELPFQLVGVGCDFYQYPIERPFGFPVHQWIQTISGRGRLLRRGIADSVAPGDGMLLYPDEEHAYSAIEEPWYVHWITFSGHHIADMLHYVGMPETGVYGVSDPDSIAALIRKALSTLASDYPLRGIDGSAIVYQLLLLFLKFLRTGDAESHDARIQRLKPAFDLIERDIDRPLSLDDLASAVGVSPQYFCDLFRAFTTRRPIEYINQRRVDRAKQILVGNPAMRIHDIARSVGFESDSYFSTVFRRFEGISPRKYREVNAGHAAAES
jgi:AraC-like DNA-binding protein